MQGWIKRVWGLTLVALFASGCCGLLGENEKATKACKGKAKSSEACEKCCKKNGSNGYAFAGDCKCL